MIFKDESTYVQENIYLLRRIDEVPWKQLLNRTRENSDVYIPNSRGTKYQFWLENILPLRTPGAVTPFSLKYTSRYLAYRGLSQLGDWNPSARPEIAPVPLASPAGAFWIVFTIGRA